jgi:hypothetical protein
LGYKDTQQAQIDKLENAEPARIDADAVLVELDELEQRLTG